MKDIVGSPGTRGGLALRVSQFVCAAGFLAAMGSAYGFSNYSAFCYLVFQMTLQLLWSFVLVCIDILSLKTNWDLHSAGNLRKYVIGDWILSIGSMAAASSSTGVAILLETDVEFCKVYPYLSCSRYNISVILASMPVQHFGDPSIHGMVIHSCICLFHILAACFSFRVTSSALSPSCCNSAGDILISIRVDSVETQQFPCVDFSVYST